MGVPLRGKGRSDRCIVSQMDVRQLAALVAIADHGSFSAAARALFTVQSNVSSHIARLEKELGVTLVDRTQGGLTDDGVRVVERARRMLRELDDIAADMAPRRRRGRRRRPPRRDRHHGPLAAAPAARRDSPSTTPTSTPSSPRARTSMLDPRACSPASSTRPSCTCRSTSPSSSSSRCSPRTCCCSPTADHELGRTREIPLAELATHRLLLPPPGSALRRVLDRAAARRRACSSRPGRDRRGPPARLARRSTASGRRSCRPPAVPQIAARRLPRVRVPELPPRVVALAYHRRPPPSAATQALITALHNCLPDKALEQPGVRLGSDAFPLLGGR